MKKNLKLLVILHLFLMVYSTSGIFSKNASGYPFLGTGFILNYGMVIVLLGFYAIGWQQIIKRMPLTSAYANRAVSVIWGLVYGVIFFHEPVTLGKLAGIALIVAGVVLFALSDRQEAEHE